MRVKVHKECTKNPASFGRFSGGGALQCVFVLVFWLRFRQGVYAVQITVELPNDLTQRPDPAREALEAIAIAGYRSGNLTAYQAGRLLGLTSRFEFEDFLKNRGIYDQAYSVEDLAEDLENLRRLKRASSDEDRWRT